MKSKLKRWGGAGLAIIMLAVAAILLWSNAPIVSDANKADPAVTLANELGSKDFKYTEGYVGEEGSRIHYVSAGEGDPIIFLHGFPSYWFTMFGLMEEFKSEYRVIALDGLGTGKSDAPNSVSDYELEKMINHLGGVIQELGIESAHFVGHDWGTALSAAYAQAYPEKVKTITMMSALPHNVLLQRIEIDEGHQELFSYAAQFSRANPALIKILGVQKNIWNDIFSPFVERGLISAQQGERYRKDIGQPRRLNRFINWYRANLPPHDEITDSHYWPDRHARIKNPALFMYGDKDIVVTEKLVEDLKAASDNLEVIVFKGIEHRPHFEQQDTVVANIRALIERN